MEKVEAMIAVKRLTAVEDKVAAKGMAAVESKLEEGKPPKLTKRSTKKTTIAGRVN